MSSGDGTAPTSSAQVPAPLTIGVVLATYNRPVEIVRCLQALEGQVRPPDQVLVVAREDDLATRSAVQQLNSPLPLEIITVHVPGVVAARNMGIEAAKTDVVAIIDDDTVPYPDWLSRMAGRFLQDPKLGGLGGRDRVFDGKAFDDRQEAVVGKIEWFGRVIGNHHLGFGDIREVDVLKGANMSFRAEAIQGVRFDSRLRGAGTQPNEDKCFSTAVKAKGWKLAYDPAVMVDHYPGFRPDARQYVGVNRIADTTNFSNFAYNEVFSVWEALSPVRRVAYFGWSTLIGTGTFPGFLQAIRYTPSLGVQSWKRFWIAQKAKTQAFWDRSTQPD